MKIERAKRRRQRRRMRTRGRKGEEKEEKGRKKMGDGTFHLSSEKNKKEHQSCSEHTQRTKNVQLRS